METQIRLNAKLDPLLPTQEYWTAKEAAAYLGYGPKTFWKHISEGNVPKYGPRQNRYKKSDLDKFMENPYCFVSSKKDKRPAAGFMPVII